MSTKYSIGQANQLMDALENAGFSPDDVTKLQQFKKLAEIKAVLYGHAEVATINHVIDCDADPFVPEGWRVEEHIKGGQLEWDSSKIDLYLDEGQKNGGYVKGDKLRKKLAGKKVLNACVLDFLLAHPELIPEEWKGKRICFWGTIYRYSSGDLLVRYLYWYGDRWYWNCGWLGRDFGGGCPAMLCK